MIHVISTPHPNTTISIYNNIFYNTVSSAAVLDFVFRPYDTAISAITFENNVSNLSNGFVNKLVGSVDPLDLIFVPNSTNKQITSDPGFVGDGTNLYDDYYLTTGSMFANWGYQNVQVGLGLINLPEFPVGKTPNIIASLPPTFYSVGTNTLTDVHFSASASYMTDGYNGGNIGSGPSYLWRTTDFGYDRYGTTGTLLSGSDIWIMSMPPNTSGTVQLAVLDTVGRVTSTSSTIRNSSPITVSSIIFDGTSWYNTSANNCTYDFKSSGAPITLSATVIERAGADGSYMLRWYASKNGGEKSCIGKYLYNPTHPELNGGPLVYNLESNTNGVYDYYKFYCNATHTLNPKCVANSNTVFARSVPNSFVKINNLNISPSRLYFNTSASGNSTIDWNVSGFGLDITTYLDIDGTISEVPEVSSVIVPVLSDMTISLSAFNDDGMVYTKKNQITVVNGITECGSLSAAIEMLPADTIRTGIDRTINLDPMIPKYIQGHRNQDVYVLCKDLFENYLNNMFVGEASNTQTEDTI